MGEMEGHHFELNKTHKRQISNVLPQIWEQKFKKKSKKEKKSKHIDHYKPMGIRR